jgi:alginate O-acetyltransferase complex protein AlgI
MNHIPSGMSLQSISYLTLLALTVIAARQFRSPRHRNILLLLASYLFYATWGLLFLAILIASSVFNFLWGRRLRRVLTARCLWTGIAINLALLALVKYLPPLARGSGNGLLGFVGEILMPVGVSFWTFEALSYLFDLYREEELDPSLLEFCLYMAFWPTVLSGPVCRLPEMLPQFRKCQSDWNDITIGTRRIIIGLFMKVVLAQTLAFGRMPGQGVNYGFDEIASGWTGIDVWALAFGYGFQLFFDFAGYTHIAIGSARLFGLRLAENFDRPYLSVTPSEFWTRWHMSLSFWIRDYVFLPLAMARRNPWWRHLSLIIAMVLFGLWHAATATLLCWGLYHGVLLVAHRKIQEFRRGFSLRLSASLENFFSWAVTLALISLGWIFFRARSFHQAILMYKALLTPHNYLHPSLFPDYYLVTFLIIAGYFIFVGIEDLFAWARRRPALARAAWLLSPLYYSACIIAIIVFSRQENLFVYFQF